MLTATRLCLDGAGRLPVLAASFHAPNSYTGQDLLELQCPGHPALLERVIKQCVASGARPAEPGEFTFRAYLAGRMDLTEAEGVAATITATNDAQLAAAQLLQRGELGQFAARLVADLADHLALVEAGIDFTDEEDVVPVTPRALHDVVSDALRRLNDLLARSRAWSGLDAIPQVVLVGAPSSGKSTLFNALLRQDRAVINPLPGTTRDVLREPLALTDSGGRTVQVMLVDIAGLDEPSGALDREVQAMARRAIEQAELVLRITDGQAHIGDTDLALPAQAAVLHVRTKCDLPGRGAAHADHRVCALTGEGVDDLRRAIARAIGERGVSLSAETLALQPRHEAALQATRTHLREAASLLVPQVEATSLEGVELIAQALRSALDHLGSLGGQMTPDDVLGRVFATFCIGK